MQFDKEAMLFKAKILSVAEKKFFASCQDNPNGAGQFRDKLYQEYVSAGKPCTPVVWLEERLKSEFLYVTEPPKWVEEEPTWPFYKGRPMVFISQTNLPENEVTRESLTWDTVLYFFGIRDYDENGKITGAVYRTVMQHPGFGGTGY